MNNIATIHRKSHFNAAHRIFRKDWDDEKNLQVFGKCAYPNFHGHNYEYIVSITGEINPETGYVMNLFDLKQIMHHEVDEYLDHKNLNLDIPEFAELIPSAENIARVIWHRLRKKIPSELKLSVRLFETERNFVDYHG